MKQFLTSVGFLVMVCLAEAAKLPANWKRCRRSDPKINDCLKKSIEDAVASLKYPLPELKLPSFEPMEIPQLTIGEGRGAVNVVQNFINLKLHGITQGSMESLDADFDKGVINATTLSPKIHLTGEYDMKGRVLLLPINGKGHCEITLVNGRMSHLFKLERFTKKGKTFFRAKDYKTTIKPEKITFNFENLLGGSNKELEDNINTLLNENYNEVFEDVKESYEKTFAIILMNLANQVFTRVPEDDIFLP